MWIIKAKKRKSTEITSLSKIFNELVFAKMALDALKAGLGSRFINRHFTYIKIEQI